MNRRSEGVLFVLEHFYPYLGGVETLFFHLARSLAGKGIPVTVITTRHLRELPHKEVVHGVTIRRLSTGNRYFFSLLAIPAAVKYARRAALIHTSTYNACIPAWVAGLMSHTKVILTVHEVWDSLWQSFPWISSFSAFFHRRFERLVLGLPYARCIAVSDATAEAMKAFGIPAEKITLIKNGVDYETLEVFAAGHPDEDTASASSPRFIYYGRLGHSKGLDLLVEAGRQYFSRRPDATVELIIPRKPARFRRRLEAALAASGYQGNFVVVSSLPAAELFQRIRHSTAVLIPSYNEGFSYVAAECTALGVPLIISGKGALQETAGGRVVQMENLTAEALCIAMQKAENGEFELRPRNRFPLSRQVEEYLSLYRSLAAGQAPF